MLTKIKFPSVEARFMYFGIIIVLLHNLSNACPFFFHIHIAEVERVLRIV